MIATAKPKRKVGRPKQRSASKAVARQSEQNRANADRKRRHTQDVGLAFYDVIGKGPKNRSRRLKAQKSFRYFCEVYFPKLFHLKWSKYHLVAIQKIEDAVLHGAHFAFAMPRGSGKSSLCRAAILWAALCGHSVYPVLITATANSAGRRLESLKKLLRTSKLLADDFPEVIYAIKHVKNQAANCKGQKFFGELTDIEWTTDKLVLPSIGFATMWPAEKPEDVEGRWITRATVLKRYAGLKCGFGSIIDVTSMEGEIRGRSHTMADGSEARPDLAVVDDPQTKKSARSLSMVENREGILSADIEYMAGPDNPIGIVMPCTVIYEGDLADRILDQELHPEFRGERSRMVETFPEGWDNVTGPEDEEDSDCVKMWRQYRTLQKKDFRSGRKGKRSHSAKFYKTNIEAMNDGFSVTWDELYSEKKGEVSAVHHAVNMFFLDLAAFYAEAQNDPGAALFDAREVRRVTTSDLLKRVNGIKRGVVPDWADCLVAYIDISESVLWWKVIAYEKSTFKHAVVDFGTWPDQKTQYYSLSSIRNTIQRKFPDDPFEVQLAKALDELTTYLATDREWMTEDDREVTIDAMGIDSGWGDYATNVYQFCRRSPLKNILHATKGVGVTATMNPMVDPEAKRKKGTIESVTGQWKVTRTKLRTPLLQYDTNFWKTKATNFMRVTLGADSSFSFFQAPPSILRTCAEQLTIEKPTRVETKKRKVDQWANPPGGDNHFFDDLVGCHVLAHKQGAKLPNQVVSLPNRTKESRKAKPKSESVNETRRRRGGRRGVNASF